MKMASAKKKKRFPTTRIEVKSAIILSTWMSCQLAMTWKCGKRQARNMAVDVVATHGKKGSCMRPKPGNYRPLNPCGLAELSPVCFSSVNVKLSFPFPKRNI